MVAASLAATLERLLLSPLASLLERLKTIGARLWRPDQVLWFLLAALLLLPLMMLSAVSSASVAQMKQQADEIATLASGIRAYYADNVIARLQAADGRAVYSENYRQVHGGIPIPATLSIELGALFDNAHSDGRISYAFLSDYPFAHRAVQPLDRFETEALRAFRADPQRRVFSQLSGHGLGASSYRLATPVLMRQACVTCHNSHPDSPRRDWKVGDVRGIQEVTVRGIEAHGLSAFAPLMGYVGVLGLTSVAATCLFRRQSRQLASANALLRESSRRSAAMTTELADQLRELSIFGQVVDRAIFGISIADMRRPDAPLIYVNSAFSEITAYPRELAVGFNCRYLQGPETDQQEVARLRKALQEGRSYSGELINVRADGRRFWNRLTLYPIFSGDRQEPDYYVGNQVDITSLREQSEGSLEVSARRAEEIEAALEALRQADRFAMGLRRHQQADPAATPEAEAFLIASQEAHRRIEALLLQLSDGLRPGEGELPP